MQKTLIIFSILIVIITININTILEGGVCSKMILSQDLIKININNLNKKEVTMAKKKTLTNNFGAPVADDQNTLTAGNPGPALMQDVHLLEKLAHFDRERIPERVVHAKGAGAYGYFEVTSDVTQWTKAKFLSKVGKKTDFLFASPPLVVRRALLTLNAIHAVSL